MFHLTTYSQTLQFSSDQINIDYKQYKLPNGLQLLVYEDHKAPIVAVNVWYHVGSKNEKPGKSGFAHLFEHLMFNGSENFNDDYFQAIERIGGTDVNGTTNSDRTNYFQNVPVSALDQVLFLESDRMGHMIGAITQELLDEQRGVVQNEKRQGENQPYGQENNYLTKAMFPSGHPYSWTVIGEMEDLNAASLEDVHEWFKKYYGAANAVVAIAGDITPDEAYNKVLKYFGDIPSGPTIERQEINIPERLTDTYQEYQDRVPETRMVMAWNTPQFGDKEDLYFDLIAGILANGKNSVLYKKLIYDTQLANSVNAFQYSREIASNFIIKVNFKNEKNKEEITRIINDALTQLMTHGPSEHELNRVKAYYLSNFIKGMERIGGFGGVSDILASNQTYFGDASYYKTKLEYLENATPSDIKATAKKWLTKGKHTLVCSPFPEYTTTQSTVDRSKLPVLGPTKESKFPTLQRATLSNGLEVILTQRSDVPTMVLDMMIDAGYKSDHLSKPGTAKLAMDLMDEGTRELNSLQINEKLQFLGANLSTGSDMDYSSITMNTLKQSFGESLDLFADVVTNPEFPQKEFDRLKAEQLNTIKREKSQPITMVLRVMTKYMYGEDHPYSNPYTGSGYEHSVKELKRSDVVNFYKTWVRPNNVTLLVTGDIDMKTLKPMLEKTFDNWKEQSVPKVAFNRPKTGGKNTLYFIDRPESQQSVIIAGNLTTKYGEMSEVAVEQMVNILGGSFTSRINMNLREDKHWSYGAGGLVLNAKSVRPFIVYAPVQTDKTAESIMEIKREVSEFISSKPATEAEVEKVKTNQILQMPGQWETNTSVNSSVYNLVRYDLPDNYYQEYDGMVRDLSVSSVRDVSKKVIKPDAMDWFVVGDKAKVMDKLKELNFDAIVELDVNGNPITPEIKDGAEKMKN